MSNIALVIANYGEMVDVENNLNQVIRCNIKKSVPPIAVGDKIIYQPEINLVTGLIDRHSVIYRSLDRNIKNKAKQKPIAANIDQIGIISATVPEPQGYLIDQFLIIAHVNNIKPIIVFNKFDLLQSDPNHANINQLIKLYQSIGYLVLTTSCYNNKSIKNLESHLANNNTILVGQSGVGKSTLTQQLLPDLVIKTGEISEKTNQGKHTTTVSKLYHLPNTGNIIDAPGIREISVSHIELSELERAYPEFEPLLGKCKFNNCLHEREPDCALKDALQNNQINQMRWDNFKKFQGV